MTKAEQNQQLLALIGDRRLTTRQMADEGACLLINGCIRMLQGRVKKLVEDGALRKVKLATRFKPLGERQFGFNKCKYGYEVIRGNSGEV